MNAVATTPVEQATSQSLEFFANRRLKRFAQHGPRCPDCAGPLVFGEGCRVCPICGFSACEVVVAR